jgi:peptidyl-prolyl cis-trans isomerase A (cyclophilin A)
VQFGIAGNPAVSGPWENLVIANDPVIMSNVRGTIAYAAEQDAAGQAVNRTTQVYINYADNSNLDPLGFTPFGVVVGDGMKVVDKINAKWSQDPDQDSIYAQGDAYLEKNFPGLDYIVKTYVEE